MNIPEGCCGLARVDDVRRLLFVKVSFEESDPDKVRAGPFRRDELRSVADCWEESWCWRCFLRLCLVAVGTLAVVLILDIENQPFMLSAPPSSNVTLEYYAIR